MASLDANPQHQKKTKKKRKKSSETLALDDLKTLGHQLLSSRSHINNLPILLSLLSPTSSLELALESLISLQSFFTPLLREIPSSSSILRSKPSASSEGGDDQDPELVYKVWLRERFDEFLGSLIEVSVSPRSVEALRDVALDAIMEFVKLGKGGKFQSAIYHRFLHTIVNARDSVDPLLELVVTKYFKYVDVRYFTYTSMHKIANDCNSKRQIEIQPSDGDFPESRMEAASHKMYKILSRVPPTVAVDKDVDYEMWSPIGFSSKKARKVSSKDLDTNGKEGKSSGRNNEVSSAGYIGKKMKSKFTKAWVSFLKLPLPLDVYKEVLATLHQNVIPYMANPAILCDFLTSSYDIGGVISVMALSGLFILMTQHGLEYHKFYKKLYMLLKPAVFLAKHRGVFFQLLDTCLRSSYLPAYLAAAFVKKLSRLALEVPPSGALVIIAIIHNLLRRHPSINFLVHKMVDDETHTDASVAGRETTENVKDPANGSVVQSQGIDPFNNEERDPAKSNAMRSSLWEIDTLRHHYCPAVSRFVASLENDLTVRAKTSEVKVSDFSSGSYATIFREEIRRRIKQVPVAFYAAPVTSLFWETDFPGWKFGEATGVNQEIGDKDTGVMNTVEKLDQQPEKRQRVEASC